MEPVSKQQEPILKITGKVSSQQFETAYFLMQKSLSPLHIPLVRAGLCFTGVVLALSLAPLFRTLFLSMAVPLVAAGVCLALAVFFLVAAPSSVKSRGEEIFRSNQTLQLPYTLSFFPEYLLLENEYEAVKEYWTDIERGIEDSSLILLQGGREKPLIVIPKESLGYREREKLSSFLQNQLVSKFRRLTG